MARPQVLRLAYVFLTLRSGCLALLEPTTLPVSSRSLINSSRSFSSTNSSRSQMPSARDSKNVLGGPLQGCCSSPMTGFFRDGTCATSSQDHGSHTICALMTQEFLDFTKSKGNDLSTPHPEMSFPGLKPGDFWCLCASRWKEGLDAGCAPPVKLTACNEACLRIVKLEDLQKYAVEENDVER